MDNPLRHVDIMYSGGIRGDILQKTTVTQRVPVGEFNLYHEASIVVPPAKIALGRFLHVPINLQYKAFSTIEHM